MDWQQLFEILTKTKPECTSNNNFIYSCFTLSRNQFPKKNDTSLVYMYKANARNMIHACTLLVAFWDGREVSLLLHLQSSHIKHMQVYTYLHLHCKTIYSSMSFVLKSNKKDLEWAWKLWLDSCNTFPTSSIDISRRERLKNTRKKRLFCSLTCVCICIAHVNQAMMVQRNRFTAWWMHYKIISSLTESKIKQIWKDNRKLQLWTAVDVHSSNKKSGLS